ncbi:LuxR family transcriptional regulator [Limimaricola soesokkakensis]|uniref:Autoinducer binding domain protein n=1 Tax=Limimaricola soesokkakensis TaxID=1343159 RepID=A0A1X7A166_9RHOB|nr:autoinducer binding domain-containing protein [Limimaricola soesokkakensis]PSK81571.1 LuxR family transcriptional regulator [Limimaricola soesokkakensis]SLN67347.1 Autoinducer binding domain protein [Limimaricola soesokkakensis]
MTVHSSLAADPSGRQSVCETSRPLQKKKARQPQSVRPDPLHFTDRPRNGHDALANSHFARLNALAPDGFNFGFHYRFSRPLHVRSSYSDEWMQTYSKWNLIVADPTVVWAMSHGGATRWSDIGLRDPLGFFATAAEHGYRYGLSIGVGPQDSRSFGTCARRDREFQEAEAEEILEIITELHDVMEPRWQIKPHQKAALELVARDFTYDAMCEHLDISRTALRNRLSGARRALGATTTAEAVRIALEQGVIGSGTSTGVAVGLPRFA